MEVIESMVLGRQCRVERQLSHYIDALERAILLALRDDSLAVLQLAREVMQQLDACIFELDVGRQQSAHQLIDALLPMEWPLWMEACRHLDDG